MTALFDLRMCDQTEMDSGIRKLVASAWKRVPAYRALWEEAGVDPSMLQIHSEAQFKRIPVITNSDLRRFSIRERCDSEVHLGRVGIERTSGSTGEPFEIPLDFASKRRRQWRFLRALMQCGYRPGRRLMMLNTRKPSWLSRVANWSCVNLTLREEELAERYLQTQPEVLYGPLNTLMMLARGLEAAGGMGRLPGAVISTAEYMSPADRRTLHQAFGTDPADLYGMSECGLLACRTGGEDHYSVAGRAFLLEFLPSDLGFQFERLVLTDFSGGAMPLIRFDTGDLVARDHTRADKPITGFSGREVDCLRMPDGGFVSPYRVTLALEEAGGMDRYRVVQRADLSLDVELWISTQTPEKVVNDATDALKKLTGNALKVRIARTTAPRPEGVRKFRPVRSEAGMLT